MDHGDQFVAFNGSFAVLYSCLCEFLDGMNLYLAFPSECEMMPGFEGGVLCSLLNQVL